MDKQMTISAFSDELAQVRTKKKEFLTRIDGSSCGKNGLCWFSRAITKESAMEPTKPVISIPNEKELDALTEIFSVFADSTRIRIICALRSGELNVSSICAAVEMSQSAVSHQLKTLRHAKVVKCRREGRNSLYSLDDSHVSAILDMGLDHINHIK